MENPRPATLGDIDVNIQTGPFGSALHKADYEEGGIPLVNPMHIRNGHIVPDARHSVSRAKAKSLQKYTLRRDDVILGRRGEMGRAAQVREPHAGYLCGTGSMFLRPNTSAVIPSFLSMILRSQHAVIHLESGSVGSTMTNLNQEVLKSLNLLLFVVPEQHEIVRRVNELFALADQIEARYAKAKEQVDKLTQSILAKAFRGELVPQDPNDEPADQLLARIRAEREAEKKTKKRARTGTSKKSKVSE